MSSDPQGSASNALTNPENDVELRKALGGARTIAEVYKQSEERLKPLLMSVPKGEEVLRRIMRLYEPWPDWVLRVAVEVWSVHFPTIRKEVIYDSFRFVHFIFFEMRIDGSDSPTPPKFPELDSKVLAAMIGHAAVMPDILRKTADEALKVGAISQEKYAEYEKQFSTESFQTKFQPHLNDYFKARPNKWLEVCEGIAEAKRKTLDEQGELKETTLTKVYAAILRDWEEIEELSGPTELCAFLKPFLDGSENDPEKRLDRVKKICRRMSIQFKPFVKGQAEPPTLSLPPAD